MNEAVEPRHIHVSTRSPFLPGDIPKASRYQHKGRSAVWEVPDHSRPSPDLAHDTLHRVIGSYATPMFPRERRIG